MKTGFYAGSLGGFPGPGLWDKKAPGLVEKTGSKVTKLAARSTALVAEGDGGFAGEALADVLADAVGEASGIAGGGVDEDDRGVVTFGVEEGVGTEAAGAAVVPIVAGIFDIEPGEGDSHAGGYVGAEFMLLDEGGGKGGCGGSACDALEVSGCRLASM